MTEFTESPTAWFAVLERAKRDHDFALAAKAQDELKRLGVTVRFSPEKPSQQHRGAAR